MRKIELTDKKLKGVVEQVRHCNAQNGYVVCDVNVDEELITVVGSFGFVEVGEGVCFEGSFGNHPRFGLQFRADSCERFLPETTENIERYLASGAIHGIGPTLAKKIVQEFGADTLHVMEHDPNKLLCIRGISPKKCEEIADSYKEIVNLRMLITYLADFHIPASYAVRSFQKWGCSALKQIQTEPYALCQQGVELDFKHADEVAKDLKIPPSAPQRVGAAILYALQEYAKGGHTCVPLEMLVKSVKDFLGLSETAVYEGYQNKLRNNEVVEYVRNKREFVYLEQYYTAESYIATRMGVMLEFSSKENYDFEEAIDEQEKELNITYETLQREAITTALSRGVMILTGGPGTGKTTTLNAIISIYEKRGKRVVLAAPTGRAAKRMSDLSGREAKTIHRLLEVAFDMSGQQVFIHNENNPLKADVVIVDEMSMVDVLMFENLLRALRLNCRVIMVGDSDQLPSVGAGNLLLECVKSQKIPTIALKEIFRQAQKSCIITNAHKIVNGEMPDLTQKDNDFFFFRRQNPEHAQEMVLSLYRDRLPNAYHYTTDDMQIITPTKMGNLGTTDLNQRLQEAVNPKSPEKAETKRMNVCFREGDKVMQVKNNYDLIWHKDGEEGAGIFNGDIGRIETINAKKYEMVINFDGRKTAYPFENLEQLELAYAITVHKSQGCEFDAVIMPLQNGFDKLSYRNLLYTAVTRAKKILILIGTEEQVERMVYNNKKTVRCSCLHYMIRGEGKESESNFA